ncbi:MAG: hypothetical protein JO322_08955 [Candidatus Eremiobacteraeota bacterium]|nr:hypothetical protein [Candidatus Eremiobacteraeota bacterium]
MAFKRWLFALGASVLFLMPVAGVAQTMESTPIPLPGKPDFSAMQFMVGTWSCRTTSSRRPAPYISTSTYTMSPDGWWLNETTVQNPVPWFNQRVTSYDKFTYDSDTKRWIDMTYGDMGTYGLTTSTGWNGNAMVWHDANFAPGADVKSASDLTVTKVSSGKMTGTSSFTEASGRTINVVSTCTKS